MRMVGLFDRPASGDCLRALREKPAIPGLTEPVAGLDEGAWQRAAARLRDVRLLAPMDPSAPQALDAHPLVREWFGQRLERTNPEAWRAAHGRLYEHLRDTTREGKTPTLESLAPLYQAIAHGCRAGRHQEALRNIYVRRICRRDASGNVEFYSFFKLGAVGSDLAAICWFFEKPYETPVAALAPMERSWVFSEASSGLHAQGRLVEALPALRTVLRMYEEAKDRVRAAAISAANLSQAELLVGEITAAVATAEKSVAYADQSGDRFQMISGHALHAILLHAAGQREEAERQFADAEDRQRQRQPAYPLLYSGQGYGYCDLLLAKGKWASARDRATKILEWEIESDSLVDRGLVRLALGRAHLGMMLGNILTQQEADTTHCDACATQVRLSEAIERLQGASQLQEVPRALLARAAFRRSVGDWNGAARDLDEVEEIAEPGPMRLYLCDMAFEHARLAFSRIEAFAPLNGLIDGSPPRPEPSGAEESAKLAEEARANLANARELIESCGYHKRDEELAELEAVLAGRHRFADLPPRV
jgi:tetratricopeptide (TPR) repeat protein